MAGKELTGEMTQFVAEHGLRESVFSIPNCTNEQLCALYSLAELLLFPSLQEGFGWPILEAQACGCRVATSAKPPMTEVGGDAAFYFDPQQVEEAVSTICRVLGQNTEHKAAQIKKGFRQAARFSTGKMIQYYVSRYQMLSESEAA